ncbi:MAG: hypothetical protein ACE5Q6_05530 [Dehalococcoidia bacterium]
MISWILGQLERNIDSCFSQRELTEFFPQEFGQARSERMLRRVGGPPGPGELGAYRHTSGEVYQVMLTPQGYKAFADDDFDVVPFKVEVTDLAMWTLDVMSFALRFQQANGLNGKPEALDPRLWFLGYREAEKTRTAYLLALLNTYVPYLSLLSSLPTRLPAGYRHLQVICPGFVIPLEQQQRLEVVGISVVPLNSADPFLLASVEAPSPGRQINPSIAGFDCSKDYTWAVYRGKEYTFTPRQALVMGVLVRAWQSGSPVIIWSQVQVSLGLHGIRIRDIFKTCDAWGDLIVRASTRGAYRLDVPLPPR